jgi:hypothetical protein
MRKMARRGLTTYALSSAKPRLSSQLLQNPNSAHNPGIGPPLGGLSLALIGNASA